jgi:protein phosphatase 2C family protein 2/3
MEDAHATVLNLDGKTGADKISFFAVYDGHGGAFQK